MDKNRLVFEDFKDLVGSTFTVKEEGFPPFALTLEEAQPLRERMPRTDVRPPFSLIFLCADPRDDRFGGERDVELVARQRRAPENGGFHGVRIIEGVVRVHP